MSDLIAFLNARLDEREAQVKGYLCIHCANPVMPLRNVFGVTGWTHDGAPSYVRGEGMQAEYRSGWDGPRCPGAVTGAQPVQDPDRALREIHAIRELIRHLADPQAGAFWHLSIQLPGAGPGTLIADWLVRPFAAIWSDHPDYDPA